MHAHALLVLRHIAFVAADVASLADETRSIRLLLLWTTLAVEEVADTTVVAVLLVHALAGVALAAWWHHRLVLRIVDSLVLVLDQSLCRRIGRTRQLTSALRGAIRGIGLVLLLLLLLLLVSIFGTGILVASLLCELTALIRR